EKRAAHTADGKRRHQRRPRRDKDDLRVIDAGGTPVSVLPGGALISSELSFAIMRGGHIDVTILGALEVDREGSLANWMIPRRCPSRRPCRVRVPAGSS
ncbi:CoA-transferase, partial [Cloacibacillus evryensis]|uniref:CoA-transferase n=1 Tax=Cloacibacillus evryensis TaxID=508460 RepID=UPI002730AFA4